MKEQPLGQSLIICDAIIEDVATHKKTLVGIFNGIGASSFPVKHKELCLYAAMSNGRGQTEVTILCRNCLSDREMLRWRGPIEFPDPNATVEILFKFRDVPFDEPGLYAFELFCDDLPLLETRFKVTQL